MTQAHEFASGKVLGLGGLFFRARDPDALTAWYRDMLGVGAGCSGTGAAGGEWTWQVRAVKRCSPPLRRTVTISLPTRPS